MAYIRAKTPPALSFINLLPSNVSGEGAGFNASGFAKEWGAPNYSAYVQQLVDIVKPDILCFDHYPTFGRVVSDARAMDTREDYVTNLRLA